MVALTAAHCIGKVPRAAILAVRAGSADLGKGGQLVPVVDIIQHPSFNPETVDYDLMILILYEPLSFDSTVQPVRLPSYNQDVPVATYAVASGWGATSSGGNSTSQLRYVEVAVVSNFLCKLSYGHDAITDRMLCAGYTAGGKDSCQVSSKNVKTSRRLWMFLVFRAILEVLWWLTGSK